MSNNNNNTDTVELKRQLESLQQKFNKLFTRNKETESRLDLMENKNRKLEEKVEILEASLAINKEVTTRLSLEVDRLDQYTRRSNIILKNVELPIDRKESPEEVKKIVLKTLKDDLQMNNEVISDIDKFHRTGYVKNNKGKKQQNIIVRFKSHCSRYACMEKKKRSNTKLAPNLTHRRGKLLYDASQIIKDNEITAIEFVFANINGDLQVRLAEPLDGKSVYPFKNFDELDDLLLSNRLIQQSYFA